MVKNGEIHISYKLDDFTNIITIAPRGNFTEEITNPQYIKRTKEKSVSSNFHLHKTEGNNKGCLKVEKCNYVPLNVSFNNELNSMRIKYVNKLIIAHLNISSLRNKFEFLVELIRR